MPIINLVVVLIIVGVLMWLVGMIPMDATYLKIIRVVVLIAVVLWLLSIFLGGNFGSIGSMRVGPIR